MTFNIPFGLDSDVDIVMGNPIHSAFRSVSTDSLTTGIPAMTSPETLAGTVPYRPVEDFSHTLPLNSSSWGPYTHTVPFGEQSSIDEALQVVHTPGNKDQRKRRTSENGCKGILGGRPELRLCPEGAPGGFFLHSPKEDNHQLSSSAPCHSGVLCWPVGSEVDDSKRQGGGEKWVRSGYDMTQDNESLLRDRNIRPICQEKSSPSPHLTSFLEQRDSRRKHSAGPREETGSLHTPSRIAGPLFNHNSQGHSDPELGSEAWELRNCLEEKRRSIEAQKRRIEAIFARHRQMLGKTVFLQLKRKQDEERTDEASDDCLSIAEQLTYMEEQVKKQEEREETEKQHKMGENEKEKPHVSNSWLEKQVIYSIESKKGPEKDQGTDKENGGEGVPFDYNEVVLKLSEALQSLQQDMQKLTEQQQQLMSNHRPRYIPKTSPNSLSRSSAKKQPKTSPHTPKILPQTPRSAIKASSNPPSQRLTSPKTIISSSCPASRMKGHSSTPCSPKQLPHLQHQPHARPSELKFPPLNRVLKPTQNVDNLQHLRRVSPSKCQVQTSSSFRIGSPQTPQEPLQAIQQTQPDDHVSDPGSCETPTQFSLELEQEAVGELLVLTPPRQDHRRAAGGYSSDAPSTYSFESDTLSFSAASSAGGGGAGKCCSLVEVLISSNGGPKRISDEPTDELTDEVQEFSSDSMSDHTESATESARGVTGDPLDYIEQLELAMGVSKSPEHQFESKDEQTRQTETLELSGEQTKGGIQFFVTVRTFK